MSSVYSTLHFMLDQVSSVLLQLALGWWQQHSLCCSWLSTAQLSAHTDPALISISTDLAGRIVKSQTKSAAPSCSCTGKQVCFKQFCLLTLALPSQSYLVSGSYLCQKSKHYMGVVCVLYNLVHYRKLDRNLQMAQ